MKIVEKEGSKILLLQIIEVLLSYLLFSFANNFFILRYFLRRLFFAMKDVFLNVIWEVNMTLDNPDATEVNWLDYLMSCFN